MKLTNKQTLFATFLAASLCFTACNNDSNLVDPPVEETPEQEIPEKIYPVDFKFITLNTGTPSISYVKNDGNILLDYFKAANGTQINEDPYRALQIEERLYLLHGGNWADNGVVEVDPTTFELKHTINLKRTARFYAMEHLQGDTLVVAGRERGQGYNLALVSLSQEEFILDQLETGFEISSMKRIGSKLFVAGRQSQNNGVFTDAKLVVFDGDNLTIEGMRTILEVANMVNQSSDIAIDANKNFWISAKGESGITMYCVNPTTETVVHQVAMPTTITPAANLCYTLDNSGKTLYVRANKAFFAIDVTNPTTLEDPLFEYGRTTQSSLNDLKMTPQGTLLVVEEDMMPSAQRSVYELDPTKGGEIVTSYLVDQKASTIYVPKYEKQY